MVQVLSCGVSGSFHPRTALPYARGHIVDFETDNPCALDDVTDDVCGVKAVRISQMVAHSANGGILNKEPDTVLGTVLIPQVAGT